jgi:hypothetical protein
MPLVRYSEDLRLEEEGNSDYDVMKVYNYDVWGVRPLDPSYIQELLWERDEVPEYTMEEAIRRMGHEFKIKK